MAWFYNGRKYWRYRGRTYSRKIKYKKNKRKKYSDPCMNALGITREQFNYEMNQRYLEKFPTHEAKLKHLGLK